MTFMSIYFTEKADFRYCKTMEGLLAYISTKYLFPVKCLNAQEPAQNSSSPAKLQVSEAHQNF